MIQFDDYLWRGPRPKNLSLLADQGFKQIINLETGAFRFFHGLEHEGKQADTAGMEEAIFPCSDIWYPNRVRTMRCVAFMLYMKQRKIKTYIHCLSGVDRTGFMCAVYRILAENWTYEKAYEEWVTLGRHWWYDWWKKELKFYGGK